MRQTKGVIMTATIANLKSALAGESQAHIKYRYFAKLARAEGFEEVAKHTHTHTHTHTPIS